MENFRNLESKYLLAEKLRGFNSKRDGVMRGTVSESLDAIRRLIADIDAVVANPDKYVRRRPIDMVTGETLEYQYHEVIARHNYKGLVAVDVNRATFLAWRQGQIVRRKRTLSKNDWCRIRHVVNEMLQNEEKLTADDLIALFESQDPCFALEFVADSLGDYLASVTEEGHGDDDDHECCGACTGRCDCGEPEDEEGGEPSEGPGWPEEENEQPEGDEDEASLERSGWSENEQGTSHEGQAGHSEDDNTAIPRSGSSAVEVEQPVREVSSSPEPADVDDSGNE
jgi:hypothetical protein